MMSYHQVHISHAGQRGAALFMALIILLVLTILGVVGMNVSKLENMMAGNIQFQTTALNDAEYVLTRGLRTSRESPMRACPTRSPATTTISAIHPSSPKNMSGAASTPRRSRFRTVIQANTSSSMPACSMPMANQPTM